MLYSGRLSLVADLLQALFRGAYSLQKSLLELLDRVSVDNSASEEEISDTVTGACFFFCLISPFINNRAFKMWTSGAILCDPCFESKEVFFCNFLYDLHYPCSLVKPVFLCLLVPYNFKMLNLQILFKPFTVVHSLLDICSIISNLDIALHATTWKFLIKLVIASFLFLYYTRNFYYSYVEAYLNLSISCSDTVWSTIRWWRNICITKTLAMPCVTTCWLPLKIAWRLLNRFRLLVCR